MTHLLGVSKTSPLSYPRRIFKFIPKLPIFRLSATSRAGPVLLLLGQIEKLSQLIDPLLSKITFCVVRAVIFRPQCASGRKRERRHATPMRSLVDESYATPS